MRAPARSLQVVRSVRPVSSRRRLWSGVPRSFGYRLAHRSVATQAATIGCDRDCFNQGAFVPRTITDRARENPIGTGGGGSNSSALRYGESARVWLPPGAPPGPFSPRQTPHTGYDTTRPRTSGRCERRAPATALSVRYRRRGSPVWSSMTHSTNVHVS